MPSRLAIAAVTLGLSLASAGAAEAKKPGFNMPVVGGASAKLLLVSDLPDVEALHRPDGGFIDLGYRFSRKGGDWVGYLGPSEYLPLDPDSLKQLLRLSGITELPPVPERSAGGGSFLLLLLAMGGIGLLAFRFLSSGARPARGRPTPGRRINLAQADAAIARAAADNRPRTFGQR